MPNEQAYENTDKEIWRGKSRAEFGDDDRYYADSLFVPVGEVEALGINCGGTVVVKPIREWHRLALAAEPPEQAAVTTIPSTASTSNGPSYDPWAQQPSASQEFDARAEFERWWRSEGITHLPKPGEPPQHAYVAARTWEAAYAAGFQRGQMPFIAGAAGKREGQHGQ